ncbi:hypothetical protein [Roseibium sp.]|uniref:hypothetical protein n=1 Tax=Roseibium sp. TaxID=1936156 RepID=UPI003B517A6C
MPKFRKKPVEIEAFQWMGGSERAGSDDHFITAVNWLIERLPDDRTSKFVKGDKIEIETLEGTMTASPGDWIIRGVQGELYPCKPDIFEATYEPVE